MEAAGVDRLLCADREAQPAAAIYAGGSPDVELFVLFVAAVCSRLSTKPTDFSFELRSRRSAAKWDQLRDLRSTRQ
jgi:hypothetical protein